MSLASQRFECNSFIVYNSSYPTHSCKSIGSSFALNYNLQSTSYNLVLFYFAFYFVFVSLKLSNGRDQSWGNHDSSHQCPNVSIVEQKMLVVSSPLSVVLLRQTFTILFFYFSKPYVPSTLSFFNLFSYC